MPDSDRPFGDRWLRFVGAARRDLDRLPARRPADQFIQFRDDVLREVEREAVANAVQDVLARLYEARPPAAGPSDARSSPADGARIAELVVQEWDAYVAAVNVAEAEAREGMPGTPRAPSLARFGKTALDSFRDIADKLPPHVKALLKLFSEVFDLFG